MRILLSITLVLLLSMTSYHIKSIDTPNIMEKDIIGEWIINDVYLAGNNVVKKTISKRNRWITFSANGQFVSGGKDFELSLGKWAIDKKKSALHMVTNAGEKSSWKIQLNGNTLEWNGIGNAGQQDFKFILQKKDWTNPS